MSRRPSLITALVVLAAATPAWPAAKDIPGPNRPNVLFIAVDDLRINLGCYGDQYARTPNIDRLAAQGTVFARAYCQQAVCNPSRQSLLSGRTPDHIRVWDLVTHFRQTTPDVVPLPEYFKRNGYFAQAFGKIYHGFTGMNDPQSWSVPEQYAFVPKKDDYQSASNLNNNTGESKMGATEFVDAPDDAYPDGKVARDAVKALEGFARDTSHQPFFLAVGFRKPHLPFTGPKRFWDLYDTAVVPPLTQGKPLADAPRLAFSDSEELRGYADMPKDDQPFSPEQITRLRRGYYAATSWADSQVGRVLDALRMNGFADNTIIVLFGDNGFHLGELGMWAKDTNYETSARIPLIVSTPDHRPRGVKTRALVELLDLYPTLLELAGLRNEPALQLDGKSFVPDLGHPETSTRDYAISQFPRPWKGNGRAREFMGYTVRTPDYRYVEWRKFGTAEVVARELYAYHGDEIFESENLADRPGGAALCDKLASVLPRSPEAKSSRDPAVPYGVAARKGGKEQPND